MKPTAVEVDSKRSLTTTIMSRIGPLTQLHVTLPPLAAPLLATPLAVALWVLTQKVYIEDVLEDRRR